MNIHEQTRESCLSFFPRRTDDTLDVSIYTTNVLPFFSRLLLCEIKYYFSNKTDSFAVLSGFELSCLFFSVCIIWKAKRSENVDEKCRYIDRITSQPSEKDHTDCRPHSCLLSSGILENGNRQLETF